MTVKVGKAKSIPRTVPGGSPQGSILGNFLFCVATNELATENVAAQNTETNPTLSFEDNGINVSSESDYSAQIASPIAPPVANVVQEEEDEQAPDSDDSFDFNYFRTCLLYTSPSPRD